MTPFTAQLLSSIVSFIVDELTDMLLKLEEDAVFFHDDDGHFVDELKYMLLKAKIEGYSNLPIASALNFFSAVLSLTLGGYSLGYC